MSFHRFAFVSVMLVAWSPAVIAQDQSAPPTLQSKPRLISLELPPMDITPERAEKVGRQVWRNETGGNRDAITSWNTGEDFASMGIGHFIWFYAGGKARFQESFPAMMDFLRKRGERLPAWLDKTPIPPCPWRSRQQFRAEFRSERMTELRSFLLDTVGTQAEFLAFRMKKAMPRIIVSMSDNTSAEHVRKQFSRVVEASPDLYPLIDYVNFKGEGISPTEQFPNKTTGVLEGWGLKHVLLEMRGTGTNQHDVLNEFADAAAKVLLRRIRNNPRDERWQSGWLSRVDTYRRPLR